MQTMTCRPGCELEQFHDGGCRVAEDAFRRLERELAYDSACTTIESNCLSCGIDDAGVEWLDLGNVDDLAREAVLEAVGYLTMRGLIQPHPTELGWMRLCDESEGM